MREVVDRLPGDDRRRNPEYEAAHRRLLEHRGRWVALVSFPADTKVATQMVVNRWLRAASKPSRQWEVRRRTEDGVVTVWGRIK